MSAKKGRAAEHPPGQDENKEAKMAMILALVQAGVRDGAHTAC
jgi:hypothetical protein